MSSTVRQLSSSDSRCSGVNQRAAPCPVTIPATTAATSPEPPSCSVGRYATKGTTKLNAVLAAEWATHARARRASRPTSAPMTTAMTTPQPNAQSAPPTGTLPTAIAATAVRRSTSEVASLSRLSPSSIVTTRGEIPSFFTIEVATASVGLRIAPRAIARYRSISGITSRKKQARAAALTRTRRIDSPAIGRKSRRNSIAGSETADE